MMGKLIFSAAAIASLACEPQPIGLALPSVNGARSVIVGSALAGIMTPYPRMVMLDPSSPSTPDALSSLSVEAGFEIVAFYSRCSLAELGLESGEYFHGESGQALRFSRCGFSIVIDEAPAAEDWEEIAEPPLPARAFRTTYAPQSCALDPQIERCR